jgi:hypothetical protein
MIILPELSIVVLGPPKCATTTLHYDLVRPPWNGFQLDPDAQHDFEIPAQYQYYRVVAPIRDPYERATSLYWHYLRDVRRERGADQGLTTPQEWQAIPLPEEEISFVDYVADAIAGEMSSLTRPSYRFYSYTISDWLDYAERVDDVIQVERLEDDWATLVGVERGDVTFSRRNAPGREAWEKYCSAEAIQFVDTWAEEDFLRYGYDHQTCAH